MKHERGTRRANPCATSLLAIVLSLPLACEPTPDESSTTTVPEIWRDLGVPTEGLERVLPESNEHGFYADYSGRDRGTLLEEVSRGLTDAGYEQSCTAVDGLVIGFSNGTRELALKIDEMGVLYLSLFDFEGKEPILHGLCFGRYHAGPWHRLTQEEKEKLSKEEGDDAEEVSATTPKR